MNKSQMYHRMSRIARRVAGAVVAASLLMPAQAAIAASSWNPTLLVNTEAFQVIDEGDSTTDIELRFGSSVNERILWNRTEGTFQFTDDVSVQGNLSGSSLRIDNNADIWGNLAASGSISADGSLSAGTSITAGTNLSGNTLRVSNNATVHGSLSVTGAVRTDNNLTINDDQTAADAVLTFGSDGTNETLTFANTLDRFELSDDLFVFGTLSGSALRVSGDATVHGSLTASGAFRTDNNITINDDGTAANAVLTFGNDGGNETIQFSDTFNEFEVSDDLRVTGGLSASGNVMLEGSLSGATIYGFGLPGGGCNGAGQKLNWNAATGKFECGTDQSTVGNGSGQILSFEPEYPNTTYVASGSQVATGNVGTLAYSYDSTNKRNFYRWQTTKTANQVYWISTRVRVPDNFSSWDVVKPIQLHYRASGSYVDVRMHDTAGTPVTLTNGSYLRTNNATWASTNITGPQSSGTWTPKGYFNVFLKLTGSGTTTTTDEFADVGTLQFNWETTTP